MMAATRGTVAARARPVTARTRMMSAHGTAHGAVMLVVAGMSVVPEVTGAHRRRAVVRVVTVTMVLMVAVRTAKRSPGAAERRSGAVMVMMVVMLVHRPAVRPEPGMAVIATTIMPVMLPMPVMIVVLMTAMMLAVPVMPPVIEASEEAAMAIVVAPVRADAEADHRHVDVSAVVDDQHAAAAIGELQVVAVGPAALAVPADVAPRVAGQATMDVHA